MIGLVLAAAGSGRRFGSDVPKQFQELEGRPVYQIALAQLLPFCTEGVVVVSLDQLEKVRIQLARDPQWSGVRVVEGGETRQGSVLRGVLQLPPEVRKILVHDAARPFLSSALIRRVLRGLESCRACIPALRVVETVKQVEENRIVRTLDRRNLVLVQTPQAFERNLLERALTWAEREGIEGTDEASLVEQMGETVEWVEGDSANIKITWPADLEAGSRLWQNRQSGKMPREGQTK